MPVYATSLEEFDSVLKDLDQRYGTHGISESKKKNGEYAIRFILKYLSYHKNSTVKEIAEDEHEKHSRSKKQVKLKSIADVFRKFIYHNLVQSQLVYHGESRKEGNHIVNTYSLSPVGILYSIHLFGNMRETGFDKNFITSIGKEYAQTLPKIFGKFELFEKVLGKDFISVLFFPLMQIFSMSKTMFYVHEGMLRDYVLTHFWITNPMKIPAVHEFLAEQISFIFYIYLEKSLFQFFQDKDSMLDRLHEMNDEEKDEYFKNQHNKDNLEYLRESKQKWLQIMNEGKELKKWYKDFLKFAAESKEQEYDIVLASWKAFS